MNLTASGLNLPWMVGSLLMWLAFVLWALRTAPWYKVNADRGAQHVLLAAAVGVFLLWQFGAQLESGVGFHFLLMTTLTLMFGPQFALLAMSLALAGLTFQQDLGWLALGMNALLMGVVPIFITWWMVRWAYRMLDRNFFVFIFFNAFLSAAAGSLVSLGLIGLVMYATQMHSEAVLMQSFMPFIPLMVVPEGFLNGMLMAAFVLFKPEWVSAFSDREYFR